MNRALPPLPSWTSSSVNAGGDARRLSGAASAQLQKVVSLVVITAVLVAPVFLFG